MINKITQRCFIPANPIFSGRQKPASAQPKPIKALPVKPFKPKSSMYELLFMGLISQTLSRYDRNEYANCLHFETTKKEGLQIYLINPTEAIKMLSTIEGLETPLNTIYPNRFSGKIYEGHFYLQDEWEKQSPKLRLMERFTIPIVVMGQVSETKESSNPPRTEAIAKKAKRRPTKHP